MGLFSIETEESKEHRGGIAKAVAYFKVLPWNPLHELKTNVIQVETQTRTYRTEVTVSPGQYT